MKKILLTLLFYSSSLFSIQPGTIIPSWYYNLQKTSKSQIIGYGEGRSLEEAKVKAREDIAKQIKTTIDSTAVQNIGVSAETLEKSYNKKIKEQTIAILEDVQLVKKHLNKEGKYFVAMSYENIPFLNRFVKKLDLTQCKQKQNNYIKYTLFTSKINKATKCTPNIKLQRKNKKWYIVHKNTIKELPEEHFEELFKTIHNKNINIKASKKLLKDGDEFYFKLKPKKDGYISILTVYEDGTVSVLVPNIQVTQEKAITIPDEEYESALMAGLMEQGKPTFDLYVTIYSKDRLDLSRFQQANIDLTTGESNKKFDELIDKLDTHDFATILLRTIP